MIKTKGFCFVESNIERKPNKEVNDFPFRHLSATLQS